MKLVSIFALMLSLNLFAQTDDCLITGTKPNTAKWDFNFMGCYNYYAQDLGSEAASKKCRTLSKTMDFSNKNFSKCNDIFQPSRSEWRASVADRCLDLYKKHDFLSKNFSSCMDAFGIYDSSTSDKERKYAREFAANKCLMNAKKLDYTSKSFINCFYYYGANYHPMSRADAKKAVELAELCTEQAQKYDFGSDKMYQCWNKKRGRGADAKAIVEACLKE